MTLRLVPKPPSPMKRSAIAVELGMSPTGGHSLGIVSDEIDGALRSFHANAVAVYGDEHGALLLVALLMGDPSYRPRPWVAEIARPHQAAIMVAFDS